MKTDTSSDTHLNGSRFASTCLVYGVKGVRTAAAMNGYRFTIVIIFPAVRYGNMKTQTSSFYVGHAIVSCITERPKPSCRLIVAFVSNLFVEWNKSFGTKSTSGRLNTRSVTILIQHFRMTKTTPDTGRRRSSKIQEIYLRKTLFGRNSRIGMAMFLKMIRSSQPA